MKTCTKCGESKELSEFNKYSRSKDGHKSECRECQKIAGILYRKTHNSEEDIIRLRKNSRRHYQNNTEKEKKRNKIFRENNKEHIQEYRKKYQQENSEKCKADTKAWIENNKEAHVAKKKVWYMKNQKAQLERRMKYLQTPEGRLSDVNSSAKRRAIKRQTSDGTVPLYAIYPLTKELSDLLQTQDYKCNDCNCDISDGAEQRHLDHIHPLSKGGQHSITNVQWLCATCNMQKSDKTA